MGRIRTYVCGPEINTVSAGFTKLPKTINSLNNNSWIHQTVHTIRLSPEEVVPASTAKCDIAMLLCSPALPNLKHSCAATVQS